MEGSRLRLLLVVILGCGAVWGQDRNFTGRLPVTQLNRASFHPRVNQGGGGIAPGRFVVFTTNATTLPGANGFLQVYRLDRLFGTIILVSIIQGTGNPAAGNCFRPSISNDGNLVAFDTTASLAGTDQNAFFDVYVRNIANGTTTHVSVRGDGVSPNGNSRFASISGPGGHVAFTSTASNLVATDTNGTVADIFRVDLGQLTPEIVSLNNDFPPAQTAVVFADLRTGGTNVGRVISDNGERIVFLGAPCDWDDDVGDCAAVNCLCPQPGNNCVPCQSGAEEEIDQIYLRDLGMVPPRTFRVSRVFAGGPFFAGNNISSTFSINGAGTAVTFSTNATNLPGDTDAFEDVFDFAFGDPGNIDAGSNAQLVRISLPMGGASSNGNSTNPMPSQGGTFVAFESTASNPIPGDTNALRDIFVAAVGDPPGGPGFAIFRYNLSMITDVPFFRFLGEATGGHSLNPDIAAFSGGSLPAVVYESLATNLVANDNNGRRDIFQTRSKYFQRGDANGNGLVDPEEDGNFICEFLFLGGDPPQCFDAADTNNDGMIDLSDCGFVEPLDPPNFFGDGDFVPDVVTCQTYAPYEPN